MSPSNFTFKAREGVGELVERIVKQIATHPDKVRLQQREEKKSIILDMYVAKEDKEAIIGKRGKTVSALRTIARAAAGQIGKRIAVVILEEKETPN